MKIKLYFGMEDAIKKSGIGRAFIHQKTALTLNGIEYVTDKASVDYDILHINTLTPDSLGQIKQARANGKKIIYHAHSTCLTIHNVKAVSILLSQFPIIFLQ